MFKAYSVNDVWGANDVSFHQLLTLVALLITVLNHRQKVRKYTVEKTTASSEAEKKKKKDSFWKTLIGFKAVWKTKQDRLGKYVQGNI